MSGFIPYLACEASAGSGKTWQLSLRYTALLFMDTPAERILCLTFTNKAAAEMQVRIEELLERLGDADHAAQRAILCGWLEMGEPALLERLAPVRSRFLRARHRIMTIDAFLNQILRQFALYSGLSPLFEIGELPERDRLEAFLREAGRTQVWDDLGALCLDQRRSAESLFEEFLRLYAQEAEIERFAFDAPDPARAAAAEAAVMAAFETFAGLITGCAQASPTALRLVQAQNVRDVAAKSWLERETLSDYTYFKKCYQPALDEAFLALKSALRAWFSVAESDALWRMSGLYGCFEHSQIALKKQAGKLDFSDITHLVYRLLSAPMQGDFFYFKLDGRIEHLLIDEFQDTSTVQFEILRPLIEEFTAGHGTPAKTAIKTFFYVGDAKQSIYRFRGGNPHLFEAVQRRYRNIRRQTLEVNYRSCAEPVAFVNRHFTDKIAAFIPQKAHRPQSGYVQVTSSEEPLAEAVKTVLQLLERNVLPEEIALLSFTNDDGQAVAEALLEAKDDLAVTTETTRLLINQPAVRTVIEGVKYLYFNDALFLANFNALRGAADLSEAEFGDLRAGLGGAPLDLAVQIAERFGLYEEGGDNLLRFLEWTATLGSIEALIFGYEGLNLSAAPGQKQGVSVLTVHKSKGLEFKHVIVIDRLKRAHSSSGKLLFAYDGVELSKIAWRFKGREAVDDGYRALIEAEKTEKEHDRLNTLYVALTRARDSLFVIRKTAGSEFEPLALEDGSRGEPPRQAAPQTPPPKTPQNAPTPVRALGRQSDVLKSENVSETLDRSALRFGLALHHALETLGGFDPAHLPLAIEAARNRYGRDLAVDPLREKIAPLLALEDFTRLIAQGPFLKEAPLIYRGEVTRLDLLIDAPDGWIVIDYKSGGPAPEHIDQVRRYLDLLKKATGRTGSGYIAYLGHNTRLIPVESE